MLEYQSIKIFLQKAMFKEVIKKVKNTIPWTYVIIDLKSKEIVGRFYEKE